jgi:hypothetical protein
MLAAGLTRGGSGHRLPLSEACAHTTTSTQYFCAAVRRGTLQPFNSVKRRLTYTKFCLNLNTRAVLAMYKFIV